MRAAIARRPLDVIVEGKAILEAKGRVGALPPGVVAGAPPARHLDERTYLIARSASSFPASTKSLSGAERCARLGK